MWLLVGAAAGFGLARFVYSGKSSNGANVTAKTCSSDVVPSVLSSAPTVVEIPETLKVIEHAGNVGNNDPKLSIATVEVKKATGEPLQIPLYDQYVYIKSGTMKVFVGSDDATKRPVGRENDAPFVLTATSGQVLCLPKGHLYHKTFPGPCEIIPICLPAFSPDLAGNVA